MATPMQKTMQQDATNSNNQKNKPDPLTAYLFPNKNLSHPQIRAIDLMLQGLTDAQVAEQLGVDRTTIFRWRKSETFARELDRHRQAILEQSTARLQSLLKPAMDILQKQLVGGDPKAQLRAAALLVRMATPARLQYTSAVEELAADREREFEEHMDRVEAYVNAPLPPGNITKVEPVKLR